MTYSQTLLSFISTLTPAPGIYQMYNIKNQIIYIGKARNLKKRVSSYFQKRTANTRLTSMVRQIDHINVIVTHNESEALLLENQLIKKYQPKYNILLRDDKSYPFIILSGHDFPRLTWQRKKNKNINALDIEGNKNKKNNKNKILKRDIFFGPYPGATAVRHSIRLMQKLFKIRVCRDNFFKNRTRPCLLYQIKKCSAPCVNMISSFQYLEEVKLAKLLLQGKNQEVMNNLVEKMQYTAAQQDYEKAAYLRDQISYLRHIQTQQVAVTAEKNTIDVFALAVQENLIAVELLWIREGRIWGNQTFYPEILLNHTTAEILSAFIGQYYLDKLDTVPQEIIIPEKCKDQSALEKILKTKITTAKHGNKLQWIEIAKKTGLEAIKSAFLSHAHIQDKFTALQHFLNLSYQIIRIVCVDISHHLGESTIGACVVMGREGWEKKNYRKFNIRDVTAGDDYAAIRQALERYFHSVDYLPDILLIDGGKNQLQEAQHVIRTVLLETKFSNHDITLLSMAKGLSRRPGLEQVFRAGQKMPLNIDPYSPAFYVLQQIRDEAHRFAITSHRQKQSQKRRISILEHIPGIGAKKRQTLLHYLGGLQEIKKADIQQLGKVPGINALLAQKIYDYFRE